MGEAKRQVNHRYTRSTKASEKAALQRASFPALEAMESRVLFSLAAALPVTEQAVNYTAGPSVADKNQNLVYLIDSTHNRLLSINTDTGNTVASVNLAAPGSGVAVSLADDKIYVAEPSTTTIEVFNQSNLTKLSTITTTVGIKQLIAGTNNRLYGVTLTNAVDQLDATTGVVLNPIGAGFSKPKLTTNFGNTHLYVLDTGSSGSGVIPEYDISTAGTPTLIQNFTANLTGATSFAVDEPSHHLYVSNSNLNGLSVINTSTNVETFPPTVAPISPTANWYFGGPTSAVGVAAQQGVSSVFGASAGPLTATIRQFNAGTGAPIADYVVDNYSPLSVTITLDSDSLRMTPNGHVLFTGNTTAGAGLIGLIGSSSLQVEFPTASFTYTSFGGRHYQFNSTSTAPTPLTITNYSWSFGDGSTSTDSAPTHTYAANGTYTVTLTVTSSGGTSDTTKQTLTAYSPVVPTPTPTPTGTAQIGGFVINDLNGNGLWNRGEPGARGFLVWLDTNNDGKFNGFEPFTTSGRRGGYLFTNLPTGQYNVGLISPRGWVQTFPYGEQEAVVDVVDGDAVYPLNFLSHLSNVGAYKRSLAAAAAAATPAAKVSPAVTLSSASKTTAFLKTDKDVLG